MGSRADRLAHEIEQRRTNASRKLDEVAGRMQRDAVLARDDARQRLPGGGFDLHRQARERPRTLLLGALGLGTALGMMSESLSMPRSGGHQQDQGGRQQQHGGGGGGALGSLMGSATGPLVGAVQSQIEDFARQIMGGVAEKERRDGAAQGNGHSDGRAQ
jgi:hypothetical protein